MAYSDEFKEKFIEMYLENDFHLSNTIKAAGLNYKTHFSWMKDDPNYAKKFELAKAERLHLEIEESENTHRQIRVGIPKKNDKGEIIGWKVPPDPRANEWFLSRRSPDYNENIKINHSADTKFKDVIKEILSYETNAETEKSD